MPSTRASHSLSLPSSPPATPCRSSPRGMRNSPIRGTGSTNTTQPTAGSNSRTHTHSNESSARASHKGKDKGGSSSSKSSSSSSTSHHSQSGSSKSHKAKDKKTREKNKSNKQSRSRDRDRDRDRQHRQNDDDAEEEHEEDERQREEDDDEHKDDSEHPSTIPIPSTPVAPPPVSIPDIDAETIRATVLAAVTADVNAELKADNAALSLHSSASPTAKRSLPTLFDHPSTPARFPHQTQASPSSAALLNSGYYAYHPSSPFWQQLSLSPLTQAQTSQAITATAMNIIQQQQLQIQQQQQGQSTSVAQPQGAGFRGPLTPTSLTSTSMASLLSPGTQIPFNHQRMSTEDDTSIVHSSTLPAASPMAIVMQTPATNRKSPQKFTFTTPTSSSATGAATGLNTASAPSSARMNNHYHGNAATQANSISSTASSSAGSSASTNNSAGKRPSYVQKLDFSSVPEKTEDQCSHGPTNAAAITATTITATTSAPALLTIQPSLARPSLPILPLSPGGGHLASPAPTPYHRYYPGHTQAEPLSPTYHGHHSVQPLHPGLSPFITSGRHLDTNSSLATPSSRLHAVTNILSTPSQYNSTSTTQRLRPRSSSPSLLSPHPTTTQLQQLHQQPHHHHNRGYSFSPLFPSSPSTSGPTSALLFSPSPANAQTGGGPVNVFASSSYLTLPTPTANSGGGMMLRSPRGALLSPSSNFSSSPSSYASVPSSTSSLQTSIHQTPPSSASSASTKSATDSSAQSSSFATPILPQPSSPSLLAANSNQHQASLALLQQFQLQHPQLFSSIAHTHQLANNPLFSTLALATNPSNAAAAAATLPSSVLSAGATATSLLPLPPARLPAQARQCNCKKSRCLKLYCECFARGDICHNCNCINCENSNKPEDKEKREKAIEQVMERDRNGFYRSGNLVPKPQSGAEGTTIHDKKGEAAANANRHAAYVMRMWLSLKQMAQAQQQQQQQQQQQALNGSQSSSINTSNNSSASTTPLSAMTPGVASAAVTPLVTPLGASPAALPLSLANVPSLASLMSMNMNPKNPLFPSFVSSLSLSAQPPLVHPKGCHCKKSECLKKYCECYQAGIRCGEACRCVQCKNGNQHNSSSHSSTVVSGDGATVEKKTQTKRKKQTPIAAVPAVATAALPPNGDPAGALLAAAFAQQPATVPAPDTSIQAKGTSESSPGTLPVTATLPSTAATVAASLPPTSISTSTSTTPPSSSIKKRSSSVFSFDQPVKQSDTKKMKQQDERQPNTEETTADVKMTVEQEAGHHDDDETVSTTPSTPAHLTIKSETTDRSIVVS